MNDNCTSEYPLSGHLDYTQGEVRSSAWTGHGPEKSSLVEPPQSWPLYIKPTYWLLPLQQTGWIELKLKEDSPEKTVRLLNTSNGGLNDCATVDYTVELLDQDHKLLQKKDGAFGRAADKAFQAAFARLDFFHAYSRTFEGILTPGVRVPFGARWNEETFNPPVPEVRYVRVDINHY